MLEHMMWLNIHILETSINYCGFILKYSEFYDVEVSLRIQLPMQAC